MNVCKKFKFLPFFSFFLFFCIVSAGSFVFRGWGRVKGKDGTEEALCGIGASRGQTENIFINLKKKNETLLLGVNAGDTESTMTICLKC